MPFHSKDLTNRPFGRLIAQHKDTSKQDTRHTYWYCICSCGGTITARADHLLSGGTQSCGCLATEHSDEFAGSIDMKGAEVKGWVIVRKATDYEREKVLHLNHSTGQSYWLGRCVVCGNEKFFGGQVLRRGKVGGCKHK